MSIVALKEFGTTLTDRPDGKKAAEAIVSNNAAPIILDFSGVIALGSSFGEEVVLRIAELQQQKIQVLNANNIIKFSLQRIVEGTPITIVFG